MSDFGAYPTGSRPEERERLRQIKRKHEIRDKVFTIAEAVFWIFMLCLAARGGQWLWIWWENRR